MMIYIYIYIHSLLHLELFHPGPAWLQRGRRERREAPVAACLGASAPRRLGASAAGPWAMPWASARPSLRALAQRPHPATAPSAALFMWPFSTPGSIFFTFDPMRGDIKNTRPSQTFDSSDLSLSLEHLGAYGIRTMGVGLVPLCTSEEPSGARQISCASPWHLEAWEAALKPLWTRSTTKAAGARMLHASDVRARGRRPRRPGALCIWL